MTTKREPEGLNQREGARAGTASFEQQMKVAREIMKKDREALRALSKR